MIPLDSQIIGARKPGRAGAYDCHPAACLYPRIVLAFLLGYKTVFGIELAVRNEHLYGVDGEGLVNRAARAFLFTWMRAYPATDSRKGIVLLDNFECFPVFALGGLLDVTLYGNVRRTLRLTWRGSHACNHGPRPVIVVPPVFTPRRIPRGFVFVYLRLNRFAQAVTKLYCIHRTYINAGPAGHAFFVLYLRPEVGGAESASSVLPRNPQTAARAAAAVAYVGRLIKAFGREDRMYQPRLLCPVQDLDGLFPCYPPASARLLVVFGMRPELKAYAFYRMFAALPQKFHGVAARAVRDRVHVGAVYEGHDVLVGKYLLLRLDLL